MPARKATKRWLTPVLAALAVGQFGWSAINWTPAPSLDDIVRTTAIGDHSSVYEVVSNSGGATVAKTYLYYLMKTETDPTEALTQLRTQHPFLVTKQSGAITEVDGWVVKAKTYDTVYRFASVALLEDGDAPQIVDIELDARKERLRASH